MTWVSVHIHYHADMNVLIGGLRPLVEESDGWFFVRYWQGGPHLRLRVRPRPGMTEEELAGRLEEGVYAFLKEHPSQAMITEADYLKVAEPLSRAEWGSQPIEPLHPDNSLRHVPYAPETARYGGTPETMAAAERNFADSSRIVLDLLDKGLTKDQRTGQALAMMTACAAVCDERPGDYFAAARARLPQVSFERQYSAQRERLVPMVARVAELAAGGGDGDSAVERWTRSVRELRERLPLDPGYARSVLLSCGHMNNNRLGVTLPEEAYLTYLLWRVSEEGEL